MNAVTTAPVTYDPRREAPPSEAFERVSCHACGSDRHQSLIAAEEDLTGKPGRFHFVRCDACGLSYQNPRLRLEFIKAYYDEEYLAHRKRRDFGPLTAVVEWAMGRHDARKRALIRRVLRPGRSHHVLDVGCGAGTFLELLRRRDGCHTTGVDFADLSHAPAFEHSELRVGLFAEQDFGARRFDLITMWHFLEHDYSPPQALASARRWLAPEGRLVVEVPRLDSRSFEWFQDRWPGLQAPQHTVLFDREHLLAMVQDAGLEVVEWLPWGAFPAYFYLYAGRAFRRLQGRGLDLDRAALPYFLGQLLLSPALLFEKQLNLAMQTVICRRAAEGSPSRSDRTRGPDRSEPTVDATPRRERDSEVHVEASGIDPPGCADARNGGGRPAQDRGDANSAAKAAANDEPGLGPVEVEEGATR